ncbi:MAG: hypothetical protein GY792_28965 [Gammaproteobacteria bacterium]|nr:hypothetical protein [Gammaproteobacteria bacterium]
MKLKRLFSLVIVLVGAFSMIALVVFAMPQQAAKVTAASGVDAWLTTGDRLQELDYQTVNFSPGNGSHSLQIQVDRNTKYQQMEGFGAALPDSPAWLIVHAPDITRSLVMSDLFSPTNGIGISYIRLPMGASDFVTGTHYTYDDLPLGMTDTQLISFSIDHDQAYIIPVLKQALDINPQIKVMASPWSAPAWMKTPETLYGGSLKPEYYQAYADYFVRFIQAYENEGIPIHAITVQNEPHHTDGAYPTMWMDPAEQANFVRDYLGPAFASAGIATEILIWDHNWNEWDFPLEVLSDTVARDYIAGSAWHCYDGTPDAQDIVHDAHPDKDIYFTECTGSWGVSQGFAGDLVWGFQNVAIGAARNWAKTVLYWNLVLDENSGPHLGGCGDCRGLVTLSSTGAITKNAEYFIVGHLSKFVAPGAYRIESSHFAGTLESVAFQNPDESIVLVVLNPQTITQSFDVQWNGQYFPYSLEPQSVATFKWSSHEIYLPVVWNDYPPLTPSPSPTATTPPPTPTPSPTPNPLAFQDFEPENCPDTDCFWDIYYAACSIDSTVVHQGNQSLRCYMHAEADGGSDEHGGTVGILPSLNTPADLSSGTTLSIWAYEYQTEEPDGNTVQLRLSDGSGNRSGPVWSEMSTDQNSWTEITWPLSAFTGIDKSNIVNIEIYMYWDGVYYFDDITYR